MTEPHPTQGEVSLILEQQPGITIQSPLPDVYFGLYPPINHHQDWFTWHNVKMPLTMPPPLAWRLLRPATMPPRELEIVASSGKPREPNQTEWEGGAAMWQLEIGAAPAGGSLWSLQIDYVGDAARLLSGTGRLLTDDWYTGYKKDGQMSLGLTYMDQAGQAQGEPSLFGSNLTLQILPLKQQSTKTSIFFEAGAAPPFGPDGVALALRGVDTQQVGTRALRAAELAV